MDSNLILVRYGELALKSQYVRRIFEQALIKNIRDALEYHKISYDIRNERGRIYVSTSKCDQTLDLLQRVFGITSVSPVKQSSCILKDISVTAGELLAYTLTSNRSFAVRVSRTG